MVEIYKHKLGPDYPRALTEAEIDADLGDGTWDEAPEPYSMKER